MIKRQLYVVEMAIKDGWLPTMGAYLTRKEGRTELQDWRNCNPDDKYRMVIYIPKEDVK